MITDLVRIQSQPSYMETLRAQCDVLANAGDMIPKHWNGSTAMVAMMLADELGIGRITALRGMYPVQGKTSMETRLMLALCLPRLDVWTVTGDDNSATATARRKGMDCEPTSVTFTFEDAKRAGYAGKSNYKSQPGTMLRWRAIAACLRIVCADALEGVYTHDELNVPTRVTDDGNLVLDEEAVASDSKVEVVDSAPTPEAKKSGKKGSKVNQVHHTQSADNIADAKDEETMRIDTRELLKGVEPGSGDAAQKAAREAGNARAKKNVEDRKKADEFWLPPVEWQEWASVALTTLGDKDYRDNVMSKLNLPKHRKPEIWAKQLGGMHNALKEKGLSVPPLPEGVLTEELANG